MKKILLFAFALVFAYGVQAQNFKKNVVENNGSRAISQISGTFTGTNFVTGEAININDSLAAGKTVFVDVSSYWCGPCWSLHHSGALETLDAYEDVCVFWVEINWYNDTQAGLASAIEGGNGATYGSQGDWTSGGTWPVPIIIDGSQNIDDFLNQNTSGVPTIYMICPNGDVQPVTTSYSAATLYANASTCMDEFDVPVVEIAGPTSGSINENYTFSANVRTVAPVTSYAWTFDGGTPATATTEQATTSFSTLGIHTITLTVSNANGSTTATKTINIVDCSTPISEFPYEEGFEGTAMPGCWFTNDVDGDGYCWELLTESLEGVDGAPTDLSSYVHAGSNCAVAWSYYPTAVSSSGWSGTSLTSNEYLITPAIALPAGSNYCVSYWVRNMNSSYADRYALKLSTTGTNESDFNVTLQASNAPSSTFTLKTHDLSAYAGQTIYLAFQHTGDDLFGLFLDDFYIGEPTGIENFESLNSTISIYPNPAKNNLYIESAAQINQIDIFSMHGALVKSVNGDQREINISDLSSGIYMVKTYTNNGVSVQKFVKE